jgi:hypothetical protein
VFSFIPVVCALLVTALYYEIYFLNESVIWFEKLPFSLYEGISIDITETWLIYLFCAAITVALQYRKPKFIFPSLLCLSALFTMQFTEVNECARQEKLIVYHVPGHVAIDAVYGRKHTFISDTAFYNNPNSLLFYVKHNWDNMHLRKESFTEAFDTAHTTLEAVVKHGPVIGFAGKKILLVNDTVKAWNYAAYSPFDVIILYGNPNLNIKKLCSQVKFKQLILTGKHKGYKRKYWIKDAGEAGINVHETDKQGAFVLNMKN